MYTWQIVLTFGSDGDGYSKETYNIPAIEPEAALRKARAEAKKEPYFKKGDAIHIKSCVRLDGRAA